MLPEDCRFLGSFPSLRFGWKCRFWAKAPVAAYRCSRRERQHILHCDTHSAITRTAVAVQNRYLKLAHGGIVRMERSATRSFFGPPHWTLDFPVFHHYHYPHHHRTFFFSDCRLLQKGTFQSCLNWKGKAKVGVYALSPIGRGGGGGEGAKLCAGTIVALVGPTLLISPFKK